MTYQAAAAAAAAAAADIDTEIGLLYGQERRLSAKDTKNLSDIEIGNVTNIRGGGRRAREQALENIKASNQD